MGFSDEAYSFLQQAILHAEKIKIDDNRNENLGYIYANLAENYRDNEIEKDSIGYYYQKSYFFFNKINNANSNKGKFLAFAYVNLGTYYLKEKQLDRSESFFKKALQLSRDSELDFITIEALSGIGSVNYYKKKYKEAKVYYCDGLTLARDKNRVFYINDLYFNLLNVYKNLGQKDSSNYYKEKYISLNDSLLKSNKASIEYSLRLFLEEKETQTTNQLVVMLIYIALVLLVVLIATIYLRVYKKKLKSLKLEVRNIDDQLQTKQEVIQKLVIQKQNSESEIIELTNLVINDNPSFFSKFKEVHADFIEKIIEQAPNIILSELRFCALIKLGFSNTEIATYTKSTLRSVDSRRYRLRKKFNIPAEVDLNDWLKNL